MAESFSRKVEKVYKTIFEDSIEIACIRILLRIAART